MKTRAYLYQLTNGQGISVVKSPTIFSRIFWFNCRERMRKSIDPCKRPRTENSIVIGIKSQMLILKIHHVDFGKNHASCGPDSLSFYPKKRTDQDQCGLPAHVAQRNSHGISTDDWPVFGSVNRMIVVRLRRIWGIVHSQSELSHSS